MLEAYTPQTQPYTCVRVHLERGSTHTYTYIDTGEVFVAYICQAKQDGRGQKRASFLPPCI